MNRRRSWLYVPATRPELVPKAVATGTDAIVVDLEDSVPPAARPGARSTVADLARTEFGAPLYVRINSVEDDGLADLRALAGSRISGIRLPKCADPGAVAEVGQLLAELVPEAELHLIVESAAGMERLGELLTAHPAVAGIGLGEADLAADLRCDTELLDWCANRLLIAARSAGKPVVQSVYSDLSDSDGLRTTTETGKARGYLGRSCIHPMQVSIVNAVHTPSAAEVDSAREVIRAVTEAERSGTATVVMPNGQFADRAMVRAARRVLAHEPAKASGDVDS
ncbi:citrate lyase subunit beta/citryl-CoA lyase [Tamaricihabitans halophyticus]|uniref:Citrate lyase subunit beta/citryl-CoA lyase n=1 Tax=Tamaricihabitans halophyticus TaxID=1262583 RepID=A0A4R2R4L2_9PSEU|nr:CoA ester lyase [Tamaricihabitans halophyticus]TCP56638.1 citrate lyase subunit beta/citryl-CoA lyase [Tamaricihabitans halophyticus]